MKLIRSKYLLIGVLAGILIGGGWFAYAAIQSQVGINGLTTEGVPTWRPIETNNSNIDTEPVTQNGLLTNALNYVFSGTVWQRARSASIGDGASRVGVPASAMYIHQGSDLLSTAVVAADRIADATGIPSTPSRNILASGLMMRDSPNNEWRSLYNAISLGNGATGSLHLPVSGFLFNGSTWDRTVAASSTNLVATTSLGVQLTAPLSTWSVNNTPAAATQATASKAAGGGTVRHVATSITACSAQAAAAQTPIAINLRDGATGAGTIIRSWKISSVIQDSKCVDLSGLAMIGTANTAMTIEFAAAGVAGSEQTVTLTGYSVP